MEDFENLVAMVVGGIEQKLAASQVTETKVKELARDVLKEEWRRRMQIISAFLAGVTLIFIGGIVKPEIFAQPIIDYLYPAKVWFMKMKPEMKSLDLSELPQVSNGIPPTIWKTVKEGSVDDFKPMLNSGFYEALHQAFINDLVRTFGNVADPIQVSEESIKKYGGTPLSATGLIVGLGEDGKKTKCGRTFDHKKLQAILVIPAAAGDSSYPWFGCSIYYPSETRLKVDAGGVSLGGIVLVGVQRDAVPGLQLRFSRKAAEALEIAEAGPHYAGKAAVLFSVDAN
jgi:hypothetical protein